MPGYKVFFRILLVMALLAGVAVLIIYLVGGFSNTKSAYNYYNNTTKSDDYVYVQSNLAKTSEAYAFIDSGDVVFKKWYSCYETQTCVFDEFGKTLFFSKNKANKDLADKMNLYQKNVSKTASALKTFLQNKAYYDEHATEEEADEVAHVLTQLSVPVKNDFYAQIETLSNLNSSLIKFSFVNTTKNNASLKNKMLEFMFAESNVLLKCLKADNDTSIAINFEDNKASLQSFNSQKTNNFLNQSVENTNEFNMLLCFDRVSVQIQQNFLDSDNKTEFVAGKGPELQNNLGYVMKVMGWED